MRRFFLLADITVFFPAYKLLAFAVQCKTIQPMDFFGLFLRVYLLLHSR